MAGYACTYQILWFYLIRKPLIKGYTIMNKSKKPTDLYIYGYRKLIGKSIRAFREKRGYSQDELAEIMDVHRSTISKVETGKFSISIDYLVKFAWYLNFDISVVEKAVQ